MIQVQLLHDVHHKILPDGHPVDNFVYLVEKYTGWSKLTGINLTAILLSLGWSLGIPLLCQVTGGSPTAGFVNDLFGVVSRIPIMINPVQTEIA